jgi:hypothetical protein
MRRLALLSSIVFAVACSKSESPPADTGMAAAPAAAPAPVAAAAAPVSLKDVAGKYTVTGKNEAGDSTLITYTLNATADTTWNVVFANGQKVSQHVTVDGDSLIVDAGPYASVLRKGVKVTTHTVYHVQDGKLMGRTVAHYDVKGPDTVKVIISEGVKK